MSRVNAGHAVAHILRQEGITAIFTLCGGHIMPIYDGCLAAGIRVVDVRHEQAAVFAADAYARLSGRPGVAVLTAGPGVTNGITAVANAWRAQSPLVVIGGQGALEHQGRGSLQEMDSLALLRPITKWAVQISDVRRIGEILGLAFRRALAGAPGPVFVEVPLDVMFSDVDLQSITLPGPAPARSGQPGEAAAVAAAAELLRQAKQPVLLLGSQFRWSPDPSAAARFAQAAEVPVFTSGMARGALHPDDPYFYQRARKAALAGADVVVVAGTPLDFRLGYGQSIGAAAHLIQIDLDPGELGRNREPTCGISADPGTVLDQLAAADIAPVQPAARRAWLEALRAEEAKAAARMGADLSSDASPVHPLRLCAEVAAVVAPDATIIGDGGDFVATAAGVLPVRRYPAGWLDPGPLGTLGIGMGYAMAARVLRPASQVLLLLGDGAAGLDLMEFEAAVRQKLPFVVVVGNDGAWMQIRRIQLPLYGDDRAVATALSHARYDQVATALGGFGAWVEEPAAIRPALEAAFASGLPALVNVQMGASNFRAGAVAY